MTATVYHEFHPSEPCDRCGHDLRHHGSPETSSACLVNAKDPVRRCLCDGWFATPEVKSALPEGVVELRPNRP